MTTTDLAKLTRDRIRAQKRARMIDQWWQETIRAEIAAGTPVAQIAEVTGITSQRVYQIKYGRR